MSGHAIVLFDGVCNLCNRSVQFIIDRDPDAYFQFAPLQSRVAHRLLLAHGVPPNLAVRGALQTLIFRRADGTIDSAPLESPKAEPLLRGRGLIADSTRLDSIVLIEAGQVFERSDAALRIARRLGGAVKVIWVGIIIPRPIRDALYKWIAAHRYRWFGRSESCRVPTPALQRRFLE